ncbi:hypothetical protein HK104_009271 [Borealophlyctis nickersoniae]|nr:hypothetical protein HK104_009271 [Borealophlyctis nickersoniae]
MARPSRRLACADRATLTNLAEAARLSVVHPEAELSGYQLYTSPSWVTERQRLVKTFAVYTGDPSHVALVAVVEIEGKGTSELAGEEGGGGRSDSDGQEAAEACDERIQQLFIQFERDKLHARETPLGVIMVGTPMRSGQTFRSPSATVREKFYQLTGINESTDFETAVFALVRVVQRALVLLGLLDASCIDGLICDETVAALQRFYNDFGPFSHVEIEGGSWCSPDLLLLVLQTISYYRMKLLSLGFQPGKSGARDEVEGLMAQIKHFQKANGLPVTKILDTATRQKIDPLQPKEGSIQPLAKALMSKLEDFTRLPTHKTKDGEGYGTAETSKTRKNEQDLDYFVRLFLKMSRKVERPERKRETKENKPGRGANDGVGKAGKVVNEATGPISPVPTASTGTSSKSPRSVPTVVSASVTRGSRSASVGSKPGDPPDSVFASSSTELYHADLPRFSGTPHGLRNAPARMLKGLKNSTTRTIGGIVEKGRSVGKGMREFGHRMATAGASSDELEDSDGEGEMRRVETDVDSDGEGFSDRGRTRIPIFTVPRRRAVSLDSMALHEGKLTEAFGRWGLPVKPEGEQILDGAEPVQSPLESTSVAVSREGMDSTKHEQARMSPEEPHPDSVPVAEVPRGMKSFPEAAPRQTFAGDSTSNEVHPRLISALDTLRRRADKLDHQLTHEITPVFRQLTATAASLDSTLTHRVARAKAMQRAAEQINAKQKTCMGRIEGLENDANRVRYGVSVLEERLEEADEAGNAFVARLKAVEARYVAWFGPTGLTQPPPQS